MPPEHAGRQRTIRLPNNTCTGSLFWFSGVVLTLMPPGFGVTPSPARRHRRYK
jgi:hypothetical protein